MPRSDPVQFATSAVSRLASAYRPAMEALGKDVQADMRQLISVPVQYVPFGSDRPPKPAPIGNKPGPGLTHHAGLGGVAVRSKPAEAPRKEFGFLYKSMMTDTRIEGDRIITRMYSDDSIAGYSAKLEEKLDRPHFKTIFERVQKYAVDRIRQRSPDTI